MCKYTFTLLQRCRYRLQFVRDCLYISIYEYEEFISRNLFVQIYDVRLPGAINQTLYLSISHRALDRIRSDHPAYLHIICVHFYRSEHNSHEHRPTDRVSPPSSSY